MNSRYVYVITYIRGCADKSLARPRRKQATATKLGIYSTYSPRSSINFLALCSNICKPIKKIQWPARRTKNGELPIVFSGQRTGGSPTGPDPKNRVGDQDVGRPGRPVYFGLHVPGEQGHFRARQDKTCWSPEAFFLPNVLQLQQQRCVILHVDSLSLWKIINAEDAVLIPKIRGRREITPTDFCTRNFFLEEGGPWAAMAPLRWCCFVSRS